MCFYIRRNSNQKEKWRRSFDEELEDNEDDVEYYDEEDDDDDRKDLHIHLKSLVDSDVLSYLLEEVPWQDLLANNKLSRTEEVKITQEHLFEEGGEDEDTSQVGFGKDFQTEKDQSRDNFLIYEDNYKDEWDRSDNNVHNSIIVGTPIEKVQGPTDKTHLIRRSDCPRYFAKQFHRYALDGKVRSSLIHHIQCEKEKKFGSNPFGKMAQAINFKPSPPDLYPTRQPQENRRHFKEIIKKERNRPWRPIRKIRPIILPPPVPPIRIIRRPNVKWRWRRKIIKQPPRRFKKIFI